MKKIPTLFERDWDGDRSRVLDKPNPACAWMFDVDTVIGAIAVPTRKWDGTAVLVRDGRLYARYDAKVGRTPPPGFEPVGERDEVTGHQPGWIPVGDGPEHRWHREAKFAEGSTGMGSELEHDDGLVHPMTVGDHVGMLAIAETGSGPRTFELCGPKVQGNPERFAEHVLIRHGLVILPGIMDKRLRFDVIRDFLEAHPMEGIVFSKLWEPVAKIKARDFGLAWPRK